MARLTDGQSFPPCVKETPLPPYCQNGTFQAELHLFPPMMPELSLQTGAGSARSQQKTEKPTERTGDDVWSPERRAVCVREETPANDRCWWAVAQFGICDTLLHPITPELWLQATFISKYHRLWWMNVVTWGLTGFSFTGNRKKNLCIMTEKRCCSVCRTHSCVLQLCVILVL